jgi:hypothetical protein
MELGLRESEGGFSRATMRKFVFALEIGLMVLLIGCGPKREDSPSVGAGSSAPPDSTPAQRVMAKSVPAEPGHSIKIYEVEELRRQGLTDPIPELVVSLQSHREIIPYSGVLGGTMAFYYPDAIHVLDSKWVFAQFDDGHIGGRGIFAFTVRPDSSIAWKVVFAELDQ